MPKTARRNTIAVLVALCVPLSLFVLQHFTRCGPDYRTFLLCCCAAATLACFVAAAGLIYSARKRAKGHPLNGITYTWAGFAASVGVLALSPFLNLRNAPCFVTPLLYAIVTGGASLAALHTVRRVPEMMRVPDFEISRLIQAGEQRLQRIQQSPGTSTREEDIELARYLDDMLRVMKSEVASLRSDREGA